MPETIELHDAARPEAPELPAELWVKIFRLMTVKEWARAAGTAKASWAASPYPYSTCLISYRGSYQPGWGGIKYISRRIGGAMSANLDVDWSRGAMYDPLPVLETEEHWSAKSAAYHAKPEDMQSLHELLSGVAYDKLEAYCKAPWPDLPREPLMARLPKLRGEHTLPFIWLEISKWGLILLHQAATSSVR